MKKTFTTALLAMTIGMVWGQNTTPTVQERLDRGVVALPAQDKGIFVSWRLLGDDAKDVTFDVVALIIASDPNSGTIMGLVENAWGVFGAAFGPVILLSLFWKKMTFGGAVAGIAVGAVADVAWLDNFTDTACLTVFWYSWVIRPTRNCIFSGSCSMTAAFVPALISASCRIPVLASIR